MNCFARSLLATLLPALALASTPVPDGGTLVIPTNAIAGLRATSTSRYATQTRVPVEGQPFAEALRCATTTRPAHSWDIQFQFRTTRKVEKGEVLWARFYARTLSTKSESGEGRVTAIFEKAGPPNTKSLDRDLDFGREWKELCLPFKALDTYEAGKASAGFHLGTQEQVVEIADFAVYSFGIGYDLKRLPHTKVAYAGQAADAPWRAAADARIEQYRKGDLAVTVTDAAGRPVPGAKVVNVTQTAVEPAAAETGLEAAPEEDED